MKEKKSLKERMSKIYSGRGFYIALFLCVAVIGAASWAIVFSTQNSITKVSLPEIDSISDTWDKPSGESFVFSEQYDYVPGSSVTAPDNSESAEQTVAPVQPNVETITPNVPEPIEVTAPVNSDLPTAEPLESISDIPEVIPTLFVWPVSGSVETPHSLTSLVYDLTMQDWRTHSGIDISAALGSKVSAVADGTVCSIEEDPMLGTCVTIEHSGGICSVYRNLAAMPTVSIGDKVSIGDTIGAVGDTAIAESGMGSHLHLELILNGNAVDPAEYLTNG